jgi:hypothetical protein
VVAVAACATTSMRSWPRPLVAAQGALLVLLVLLPSPSLKECGRRSPLPPLSALVPATGKRREIAACLLSRVEDIVLRSPLQGIFPPSSGVAVKGQTRTTLAHPSTHSTVYSGGRHVPKSVMSADMLRCWRSTNSTPAISRRPTSTQ